MFIPTYRSEKAELPVQQVWQDNLEEELDLIRDIVDDYPYLAMGKNPQRFIPHNNSMHATDIPRMCCQTSDWFTDNCLSDQK